MVWLTALGCWKIAVLGHCIMTFLHGWSVQQKLHVAKFRAFSRAQTWLFHGVDLWELYTENCQSTSISVEIWAKEQQMMRNVAYHILPLAHVVKTSATPKFTICHTPTVLKVGTTHPTSTYLSLINPKTIQSGGRSSPPPPKNNQALVNKNQTHHTKGSIGIGLFTWKLDCFEVVGT